MPKKMRDTCPTCGTVLGPLHDKDALRRCTSCSRINPRGFYYCGYCAAPMETTAHRAELAEVAAPPGGWPSLTREMIEVRFFMERGELDEAFEMIGVLRDRYPGHPELVEFTRSNTQGRPRPDTQVNRVVDSVLSGSASLGSAMPRRAAPTWKAPEAGPAGQHPDARTQSHEVVPSAETPAGVRKRVLHSGEVRNVGSFPAVDDDVAEDDMPTTNLRPHLPKPEMARTKVRMKTDKHVGAVPPSKRPKARPPTMPQSPAIGGLPVESTEILSVDMSETGPLGTSTGTTGPEVAPPAGLTVAVPTLQPPRPFLDSDDDDDDPSTRKNVVRKRALKSRKRSGKVAPVEAAPEPPPEPTPPEGPRPRRRPARFGQHVLSRLGGKD